MKKYIKYIVIAILLICLISLILITKTIIKNKDTKICNDFELNDVIEEINLATGNVFDNLLEESSISEYLPISFFTDTNYVFCYNDDSNLQYFVLAKNLSEKEMFELESYIETNNSVHLDKQIKLQKHGEYTYAILSEEYSSIIEGIIRSYIYCN